MKIQTKSERKEKEKKTVQYLKVETESGKRIQTEETLEIKILRILTEATEVSFSNQTQELEERVSDIGNTIKDMDTSVKTY